MLAEMHDHTFRLGNVATSSYEDILLNEKLLQPLTESFTLSAPMCQTCAFEPYCGADPVFHHATTGDFVGHKATSAFCRRNMGIATKIFNHQLCVLNERLWPFAVRSISDWKNDYLEICDHCSVRDTCGGVFATSGNRLSRALQPIHLSAGAGESGS
jgi:hypothetical protein